MILGKENKIDNYKCNYCSGTGLTRGKPCIYCGGTGKRN